MFRVLLCDMLRVGAVEEDSGLGCLFLSSNWEVPQPRQLVSVSWKQNLNRQGESPGFLFVIPVLSPNAASLPVWSYNSNFVSLFP